MFHKILVVLDTLESRSFLAPIALAYSKSLNALLHLVYPTPSFYSTALRSREGIDFQCDTTQGDALSNSATSMNLSSMNSSSMNLSSPKVSDCPESATAICKLAQEWNADLMILGRTLNRDRCPDTYPDLIDAIRQMASCSVLLVQRDAITEAVSMQMMLCQPSPPAPTSIAYPSASERSMRTTLEKIFRES